MNENCPNLQNEETKSKKDIEKFSNKEHHESVLNFKLTLRKNKINNHIFAIRMKNEAKNKDNRINDRKKLLQYKKLFEIEKIKETLDKIFYKETNINYMKDKKFIELIHLYSQHLNNNENVKNIFVPKIDNLINLILYEIVNDINSQTINFELFDYYLIILGNLFLYTKSIIDNNNQYLTLLLNILKKNTNLEIYKNYHFDIINDTLWLIHLYLYFVDKQYISYNSHSTITTINDLFSNKFFEELSNFYNNNHKQQMHYKIIEQIINSQINIYLSIFENLSEINKNEQNNINIDKKDFQSCINILIKIFEIDILKDKYNEDITHIIFLILHLRKNKCIFKLDQFYNYYIFLFDKYKNYDYENNEISKNLIIILFYLICDYYRDDSFNKILKDSDIIPLCIQYYLKNGSIIHITLNVLNMIFNNSLHYHKIIIKSINYQLLDNVCEILINTNNNENIIYECLKILIKTYLFLENNIKNTKDGNVLNYFNLKIIARIEQLIFNDNKDISELATFLYKKFKNIDN